MMCIGFMNMVNGEYHEPQIEYNMTGLLNEIKRKFPNDPNPDLNNPKYKDIVKSLPYAPLIAGGLAKTLGIKDEFMTLELWRDLSNGYCPAKYLPKVNEAESLMRFAIETPRGLMVKFNKSATPIGADGEYKPKEAKKDKRIGTEFVFGLGRNASNVLTAMELADPEVEMKLTAEVNRIFSEVIIPEMERDAYVRMGADGAELNYVSKLLAVVYHHTENRGTEQEGPEAFKHWHFDLMNVAVDEEGEKMLSVCNDLITKHKDSYTALLQRHLMPFMKKEFGLTFKPVYIDEDRDNPFLQDHEKNIASWDVEDKFIPATLREELGAREKEMEAEMRKHGVTNFAALEIARKETRDAKTELSPSELKALWAAKYAKHGFTAESFAHHQDFNQVYEETLQLPSPEQMVANYVRKHKDVVFTEDQIKSHVFKQLVNMCDVDTAERHAEYVFASQCHQVLDKTQREYFADFLADTISNPELRKQKQIRFGRDVCFTTTAILEMDKYISTSLKAREHEIGFVIPKTEVFKAILEMEQSKCKPGKPFQFSSDQKNAIILAMSQPGAVMNIAGRAGSGKSTLLRVVKERYEANGFIVLGTSIQGSATKELAKSTGMEKGYHYNTAELLKRVEKGTLKLSPKHVLFCDEAGMADTETLYKLIKAVNAGGSKLILTGEKEQLQPVSAGGSFKVLNEQFTTAPVTAINRQRDQWQRDMVEDFASGRSHEAVDRLVVNGKVIIKKTEKGRLDQIVHDYLADKNPAQEKFIIGATNFDLERINQAVRTEMKKQKLLPEEGVTVRGKDGIDREFAIGDRLIFYKNQNSDDVEWKNLSNSESGRVASVMKYLNGRPYAVQIVMDDGSKHHLTLGKEHAIKHAYAVTVHKSQGSTKESVFFFPSKTLNSLHSAYVACSRHIGEVKMYLSEEMVETLASKMEGKPCTPTMKRVAESVAKKNGLEIAPSIFNSFMETREWLTTNMEKPDPEKGRKVGSIVDDFKSIVTAMGQTQYKKTTWDFDRADGIAQEAYLKHRITRGYRKEAPNFVGPHRPAHLENLATETLPAVQASQLPVQKPQVAAAPSVKVAPARTAGMFAYKLGTHPAFLKAPVNDVDMPVLRDEPLPSVTQTVPAHEPVAHAAPTQPAIKPSDISFPSKKKTRTRSKGIEL